MTVSSKLEVALQVLLMIFYYFSFLILVVNVVLRTSSRNTDDAVQAAIPELAILITLIATLTALKRVLGLVAPDDPPVTIAAQKIRVMSLTSLPLMYSWLISLLLVASARLECSLAFLKANSLGIGLFYDHEKQINLTVLVLTVVSIGFALIMMKIRKANLGPSISSTSERVGIFGLPIVTLVASYCLSRI